MLNPKETKLLIEFLEDYSNELSNRGCNDVDEKVFKNWSREERVLLAMEIEDNNGTPEEFDPKWLNYSDIAIVGLFISKLKESILE